MKKLEQKRRCKMKEGKWRYDSSWIDLEPREPIVELPEEVEKSKTVEWDDYDPRSFEPPIQWEPLIDPYEIAFGGE